MGREITDLPSYAVFETSGNHTVRFVIANITVVYSQDFGPIHIFDYTFNCLSDYTGYNPTFDCLNYYAGYSPIHNHACDDGCSNEYICASQGGPVWSCARRHTSQRGPVWSCGRRRETLAWSD